MLAERTTLCLYCLRVAQFPAIALEATQGKALCVCDGDVCDCPDCQLVLSALRLWSRYGCAGAFRFGLDITIDYWDPHFGIVEKIKS